MKLNIADTKEGKTYNLEVTEEKQGMIIGKKVGDTLNGNDFGYSGYEFRITGGSDKQGFPMRPKLPGAERRKMLLSGGQGFSPKRKGERAKKSVRGNTISNEIIQVNCTITKHGSKPLVEEKKEEEPKTEEK